MRFVAIAIAAFVALLVLAGVLGSVYADFSLLHGSAGWYGAAVFLAFPALIAFAAWRWG